MDAVRVGMALDSFIEEAVTVVSLAVHDKMTREPGQGGTPIDTQFAISNWIIRSSRPFSGVAGKRPSRGGPRDGFIDYGPSGRGRSEIIGYKLTHGLAFITNNVDYIIDLNQGTSPQAPAGFVPRNINQAIRESNRGLRAPR